MSRSRSGMGGRGRGRYGGMGRRGETGPGIVVIDTIAPLEMFRRFVVRVARGNVAEQYRRRRDVFPCSYSGGGDVCGTLAGGRGRCARILVDADGDSGYVMDAVGRPIVRSGVGLLRVPPGGKVRKIDYKSASGGTALTWRWDPDHAYRRLGRVNGTATNLSLEYLGVAGVVTPEWAVGQGPIMRAKRERAAKSWPAAPDLRTAGFNRRDRREAERRELASGARLRFPTGYEDDGRRGRGGMAEHDGTGIPGMPPGTEAPALHPQPSHSASPSSTHAAGPGRNAAGRGADQR